MGEIAGKIYIIFILICFTAIVRWEPFVLDQIGHFNVNSWRNSMLATFPQSKVSEFSFWESPAILSKAHATEACAEVQQQSWNEG